jgi:O-antigen/teichoic acid export membrane protein
MTPLTPAGSRAATPDGVVRRLLHRLNDGRGVSASAATSILARAASILTAMAAVPIALHALGEARFATFLVLLGFINWLNLGSLGVQSAVGRLMAGGYDPEGESDLLGAALVFAGCGSLVCAALVSVALAVWARGQPAVAAQDLAAAATLMVVLGALQVVLQVFEGVQIGRLQSYQTNLMRLIGSAYTIICLLVLPRLSSSMMVFIVAMNGGLLLSSVLNALLVMRTLRPSFSALGRNIERMRNIGGSGLAFFFISIASVLQMHVPLLILTQITGPASAVGFGVLTRLLFSLLVVVNAVTMPLWPALIRARVERDEAWARRALVLSGAFAGALGLTAFLGLALYGAPAVSLWMGRTLAWSPLFQTAFGLYGLLMVWSNYWGIVLVGQGRERLLACIMLPEGLLIALSTGIGAHIHGATGAIVGMVLAVSVVSFWLLPTLALLRMRDDGRTAPGRGTS